MGWDVILFDMDGTLSDSGIGITRCAQYALQALGYEAEDAASLRFFVGPPLEDSYREHYDMTPETIAEGVRLFRERYAKYGIEEHAAYPGIPEMLRALKAAGKRLGLASSKPRIYAEHILEVYGVRDCFEQVMGSELDGRFGTKTLVMEELLRRMNVAGETMERTVMVGDRKYDIEGAHNHGLPCIGVEYGYAEPGELTEADHTVATVEELQAMLLTDRA